MRLKYGDLLCDVVHEARDTKRRGGSLGDDFVARLARLEAAR